VPAISPTPAIIFRIISVLQYFTGANNLISVRLLSGVNIKPPGVNILNNQISVTINYRKNTSIREGKERTLQR